MGIFSRIGEVLSLARSSRASTPSTSTGGPSLGPLTKRGHTILGANDYLWAQKQAERLFGPFNPRFLSDWVLKRMMTDWTIGFCREIWLSGFAAADYHFDGGSAEIRAFLTEVCERHLAQWREKMLLSLDFGRQTCELVWDVTDVAISYAEKPGEVTERLIPGAYVLGELRDLDPEHIEIVPTDKGDFAGIRFDGMEIPAEKLLHVVSEGKFGALLGEPRNVRAYIPWWRCNYNGLLMDRYLEKKGDPPIIGQAPGEEVADGQGNIQDPVKVTAVGLANLRSGGSYVFPSAFDPDSKQQLYGVRTLEVAQRAPEFLSVIDRHELNKRLAWLIPGGLGQGQSFAADKVSQQLVDRFFDRHAERLVIDPVNHVIAPRLVRANYPQARASDIPKFQVGDMAINARGDFLELVRSALALETITPDGRPARVSHCIDLMKGLKKANIPATPTALIPTAPPIEVQGSGQQAAQPKAGFPGAGRPPSIAPEMNRPNAPGRPGMPALARGRGAADKSAWISEKIKRLIAEGKPQEQAIAIAESMWRQRAALGKAATFFRGFGASAVRA